MPETVLAVMAASWGVIMALAPLLQVRRMLARGSSEDVSVAYLVVLLPGFMLWVAYGAAIGDLALLVPNVLAAVIATVTLAIAMRLRRSLSGYRGPPVGPDVEPLESGG